MNKLFSFLLLLVNVSALANQAPLIFKKVLPNGLTVLVCPVHTSEKVSMQLWYHVGSKDECDGQRGLAHLIEHMIFKGTNNLSETDIPFITHKLSAQCNASTSFDWTRYYFNVPKENWREIMPIMADCMNNCTFKKDLLNAEMKTVVQELKMYKDYYGRTLLEKLIEAIFPDHPYHFPVVGYKQDLWSVDDQALHAFYKKHYLPNNAALVIVGDVNADEAIDAAQKAFGAIAPHWEYEKKQHYLSADLIAKTVVLYRDVHRPLVMLAFTIPGIKEKKSHIYDFLSCVLTNGKSARLHKKFVDELQTINSIDSVRLGLFDHDLFLLIFEPKNQNAIPQIIDAIVTELDEIKLNGLQETELKRASKIMQARFYDALESNFKQAEMIGESFLATQNPKKFFKHRYLVNKTNEQIKNILKQHFRPSIMHQGLLLLIDNAERTEWMHLQHQSDLEDAKILAGHIRESEVEQPRYSQNVQIYDVQKKSFPKPTVFTLDNGLEVLSHHNPRTAKISIQLKLKANADYDSDELPGLYKFLSQMLYEGTKNYTAQEFAYLLESHGISLQISPGIISMSVLKEDLSKGLALISELGMQAAIPAQSLEKVRAQALSDYYQFLDNPSSIAQQLVREYFYKKHPLSKNLLGNPGSLLHITRDDLINFYKKVFTPYKATLAIVGDIAEYDLRALIEKTFSAWQGDAIEDLDYNVSSIDKLEDIYQNLDRDQTVLIYAGQSIDRNHEDYDKLLIFDQIFGSGMQSRLFQLRQQTGVFYTINGSLLAYADNQQGLTYINTIVSNNRINETKQLIENIINNVADSITEQEVEDAKRMILYSIDDLYAKNRSIASTFLYLKQCKLPFDYSDKRVDDLSKITVDDIKQAVKKVLKSDRMCWIQVGR
ncbi:MAG: pitrilysin family protein [Candidatus Babeliales bacterium]